MLDNKNTDKCKWYKHKYYLVNINLLIILFILNLLIVTPAVADNNYLTADDFKHNIYRGFTLDGKRHIRTDDDMKHLGDLGVDLVRVGLGLKRCDSCRYYTIPDYGIQYIDWVIQMAKQYNYRVVITLVPENPYDADYWHDDKLQESIADVWKTLAKRYKNISEVAGYDILNEPKPPGKTREASMRWVTFASIIIDSIRQVDNGHIVFFEPAPTASAYGFKALKEPLSYKNIVYSLHLYTHVSITHQGIKEMKDGVVYPNNKWDKERISKYLEPVRQFAKKNDAAIYVGELGIVRWAPDNSAYRWIRDVLDLIEKEGWSWTFHSYRGWHGWDHELPPMNKRRPKNLAEAKKMRSDDTATFQIINQHLNK